MPCRAGLIVQGITFVKASGAVHCLVSCQLDFLDARQTHIIHFLLEGCPVVRSQLTGAVDELRNARHLCIVHRGKQVGDFLALVIGESQNIRGAQVFIGKQAAGRLSDQRRIPLEEGFVVNGLADGKAVTQETPALLTGRSSLFSLIIYDKFLIALKLSPSTP